MHARFVLDSLFEMAAAPASLSTRTYYHGTSKQTVGEKILADGAIKAPEIADLDSRYGKSNQRPVDGRAYLSPSLRYAVIYAIGANMAGSKLPDSFIERGGQLGYLFVVDGKEIKDVEPDEDQLGALVSKLARLDDTRYDDIDDHPELTAGLRSNRDLVASLSHQIKRSLTPNMYQRAGQGDASWQSKAGKRLLRQLPDYLRTKIAELGSSISIPSAVPWAEAWSFDKNRCQELKRDCTNFFDIAQKVA